MRSRVGYFAIAGLILGFPWSVVAAEGPENVLQVGDLVPQFCCLDDNGKIWNSHDHIGQRVVVFYFYRSDFSFCCTLQAQGYRDSLNDFQGLEAEVVGVSGDTTDAHRLFKSTHRLNFPLLSDSEGAIARQFGVPLRIGGASVVKDAHGTEVIGKDGHSITIPRNFTSERWTFIVGKDGRVVYRETTISPVKDSQEVLEFICNLDCD